MGGYPRAPRIPQFCTHRSHPTQYLDPLSSPPFTMGIHFVRIWEVSRGKGLSAQPGEGEAAPRQAGRQEQGPAAICSLEFPHTSRQSKPRDAGCQHQAATSLLSCCEGATLGRAQLLLVGVSNPQPHRAGGHQYMPTPQGSTETPVLGTHYLVNGGLLGDIIHHTDHVGLQEKQQERVVKAHWWQQGMLAELPGKRERGHVHSPPAGLPSARAHDLLGAAPLPQELLGEVPLPQELLPCLLAQIPLPHQPSVLALLPC